MSNVFKSACVSWVTRAHICPCPSTSWIMAGQSPCVLSCVDMLSQSMHILFSVLRLCQYNWVLFGFTPMCQNSCVLFCVIQLCCVTIPLMFCLGLSLGHSITCNNRHWKNSPASLIYHLTLIPSRCNPSLEQTRQPRQFGPGWQGLTASQTTYLKKTWRNVCWYCLGVLLELVSTFQYALSSSEAYWVANCVWTRS